MIQSKTTSGVLKPLLAGISLYASTIALQGCSTSRATHLPEGPCFVPHELLGAVERPSRPDISKAASAEEALGLILPFSLRQEEAISLEQNRADTVIGICTRAGEK